MGPKMIAEVKREIPYIHRLLGPSRRIEFAQAVATPVRGGGYTCEVNGNPPLILARKSSLLALEVAMESLGGWVPVGSPRWVAEAES